MGVAAINYDPDIFYFNLISRELYKTSYYSNQSFNSPKLTILNKLNRSHYWFPANTGSYLEKKKMLKLRSRALYPTFSSSSPVFVDLVRLQIKSLYDVDVEHFIKSTQFNNTLALLNETFRKQNFKRALPKVKQDFFNTWNRPPVVNRNLYLTYFIDFSPHRSLSKFRKFKFISLNTWWFESKWIFAFLILKNKYLKWFRPERFQSRFLRFPGMSFSYWAEQQLKHNYYNINSFDLASDPYASKSFMQHYPPISSIELQTAFKAVNNKLLAFSLFYWFLKNSQLQNNTSQLSYFGFSYATQRYTYGASRLYLKNHYASLTPKYAHAYFNRFRRRNFTNVYSKFRWYICLAEPVYWNLKDGLDFHPHEFWTWEEVSWWEDNVTFSFFRFKKNRRQARFFNKKTKNILGYYNLDSIWLYKTWFHEHIFLELISSYFKSYLNFQYLIPNSRFYSEEYPKEKLGHFDPKWQDRLYEYTFHHHPDYFFPSTNIFYDYYADSVLKEHLESFLMLNFSWKFNDTTFFFPKSKKFLPKFIKSVNSFANPLDDFTPAFSTASSNTDFIFPLLIDDNFILMKQLTSFENCLIFLLNFFYKSDSTVKLNEIVVNFLYNYLVYSGLLVLNKKAFVSSLSNFKGVSYADFNLFLLERVNLLDIDCNFHKERIVVEYTAFKRWYTLLISEYINNK